MLFHYLKDDLDTVFVDRKIVAIAQQAHIGGAGHIHNGVASFGCLTQDVCFNERAFFYDHVIKLLQ